MYVLILSQILYDVVASIWVQRRHIKFGIILKRTLNSTPIYLLFLILKRLISQPAGFAAYPTITYSCVDGQAAGDTTESTTALACAIGITPLAVGGTASDACTTSTLATGCTRTLTGTTSGITLTAYCNSATDASNQLTVASCYVGTFSVASTTAVSTTTTSANPYCQVYTKKKKMHSQPSQSVVFLLELHLKYRIPIRVQVQHFQ